MRRRLRNFSKSMMIKPTEWNNNTTAATVQNETVNAKIYFFDGIYDNDTAYNILNETELLSTYGSQHIGTIESISLSSSYNNTKKTTEIFSKTDSEKFTPIKNGIICWCCIRIGGTDTDAKYIFTDMIGTTKSPNVVLLNNTTAITLKETVLFRLKIEIRTKLWSEE